MPNLHVVLDTSQESFEALGRLREAHPALDGDELAEAGHLIHLQGLGLEIGALPDGMASGAPAVSFCFELPDGRVVVAETSLKLLLTAADAFRSKYGDPRWEDSTSPELAEFQARYAAAGRVEGAGESTAQVMACPFCAEPGFQTVRIMHAMDDLQQEATCSKCGRSGRSLVTGGAGEQTFVEFVQTGGDDPPEWLAPAPRRIDREEQADAE